MPIFFMQLFFPETVGVNGPPPQAILYMMHSGDILKARGLVGAVYVTGVGSPHNNHGGGKP